MTLVALGKFIAVANAQGAYTPPLHGHGDRRPEETIFAVFRILWDSRGMPGVQKLRTGRRAVSSVLSAHGHG